MKVYLAMLAIEYEGEEVLGVYDTALKAANRGYDRASKRGRPVTPIDDPKDWTHDVGDMSYYVDEWDVD